jgi:hypothetical protein
LAAGAVVRTLAGLSTYLYRARLVPPRSLLATASAALLLIALGALLLPEHSKPTSKPSVAVQAGFPFQLGVQADGNGINIRWDPKRTPPSDARKGRLVISGIERLSKKVKLDSDPL